MNSADPDRIAKHEIRRAFGRAAPSYDAHAFLQTEVADRMLERLDLLKLVPETVLDVGSGTGYCTRALRRCYRKARVIGIDLAPEMVHVARRQQRWFDRTRYLSADAERLPIADATVDMIVSNLTLQWCDPDAAFREFRRVLKPDGVLMFTSFGPDTLKELRQAWRVTDNRAHVHRFIDMHDLGDALGRAGFAGPVMDADFLTLSYGDVITMLRELKGIGAHNLSAARARGLMGRRHFARFRAAYEAMADSGRIPATYEVVYGHAWAPSSRGASRHGDATFVPVPAPGGHRR